MVGLQKQGWILLMMGKAQKLLFPLVGRLQLALRKRESIESHESREALRCRSGLLTERVRADVHLFYFRRSPALGHHQQRAKGGLQAKFLLGALGSVRQGLEQL